ncbi:hypothetical protein M513_06820 [Trichuris suis]|uniref:Uncharacterized protein n=1 Tax=Trichuris suis TaxID=68888 RepID=A0A085M4W1_9BILA|nr:hypothetical protein M513_06820 [Trichuris suis]
MLSYCYVQHWVRAASVNIKLASSLANVNLFASNCCPGRLLSDSFKRREKEERNILLDNTYKKRKERMGKKAKKIVRRKTTMNEISVTKRRKMERGQKSEE